MSLWSKVQEGCANILRRLHPPRLEVHCDDFGIWWTQTGEGEIGACWEDITRVYAYCQEDWADFDQIRLVIEAFGEGIDIPEKSPAYVHLVNELPRRLPNCLREDE